MIRQILSETGKCFSSNWLIAPNFWTDGFCMIWWYIYVFCTISQCLRLKIKFHSNFKLKIILQKDHRKSTLYQNFNLNQIQGGRKQIFYGGAIVKSEKWIFKNSQNLLNKSPKHGGQVPPCADCWTTSIYLKWCHSAFLELVNNPH